MNSFVFAFIEDAIKVDNIHKEFDKVKTWRDLKTLLEKKDFQFFKDIFEENEGIEIDEKLDFPYSEFEHIIGVDFPPYITTFDLFNDSSIANYNDDIIQILKIFGEKKTVAEGDEYIYNIQTDDLQNVISALSEKGYLVKPAGEIDFDL